MEASPLGGGSISAGDVVRRGGQAAGATRGPTGPGLSRLPLTTPQVMPYLTTSWGYIDINIKVQGASWFGQNAEFPNADYGGGAGNIGRLVQVACTTYPGRC